MLAKLFPRINARVVSLRILGPLLDQFVVDLHSRGYGALPIRLRVREAPRLEARLRRCGIRDIRQLSRDDLLAFAPRDAAADVYMAALVHSLVRFLDQRGLLKQRAATPAEQLLSAYSSHLQQVRGLAASTVVHHQRTASEFLSFLGFESGGGLRDLQPVRIEEFVRRLGERVGRESLQHTVAHLRSFLRFLEIRGEVPRGLQFSIDTPRVYRGERLPRSLPWETVTAFLKAIDRSTPMGRRDYAMFLLVATYGLRTSEIAALRLDDVEWRASRIRVRRPKTQSPLVLPLTDPVGAALLDYLRHARPSLPLREIFLRVRAPSGPLAPTAVTEAFQKWTRRGRLPIPYQGPHCLRHSLAVHLLRQGASLKAIGDLLGHRSAESTCVYLRLHVEDLRDAGLDLPAEVRS
ncbi:MAG TPA: site-specific integrase [Stellaceae bacterium]|nr:site-specific integrase [Stellaceae bacterium]